METQTKYINGEIRKQSEEQKQSRTVDFVISTAAKDRHGTILNMNNWNLDNFNRNGIVGYQHNVYGDNMCFAPDPDDVIGRGEAFLENGNLIGRVHFEPAEINPLAEKVYQKVLFGSLRATSVGFLPLKDAEGNEGTQGRKDPETGELTDKETFYFHGQELLEFSIVNIPSNPEAVRKSIRSQSAAALTFVNRALGGKYRFSQIENFRVRDILDLIDGKVAEPIELISANQSRELTKKLQNVIEINNDLKNQIQALQLKTEPAIKLNNDLELELRYYKNKATRG